MSNMDPQEDQTERAERQGPHTGFYFDAQGMAERGETLTPQQFVAAAEPVLLPHGTLPELRQGFSRFRPVLERAAEQVPAEQRTVEFARETSWVSLLANARLTGPEADQLEAAKEWVFDVELAAIDRLGTDGADDTGVLGPSGREQLRLYVERAAQGRGYERAAHLRLDELVDDLMGARELSQAILTGDAAALAPFQLQLDSLRGQQEPFLTQEDVVNILQYTPQRAGEIMPGEMDRQAMRQAGTLDPRDTASIRVDVERQVPGAPTYAQGKSLSYQQAMGVLYQMSEAEIETLQDRMEQAGMFDQGGPQFRGDPSDGATQQAWRTVIHEAVAQRTSVYQLFDSRIQMRERLQREAEEERRVERRQLREELPVSHPDRSKVNYDMDRMAQQVIGRRLTGDEQTAMYDFVRQLNREQVLNQAAFEEGSVNTFRDVDVTARVGDRLREIDPEYVQNRSALEVLSGIDRNIRKALQR